MKRENRRDSNIDNESRRLDLDNRRRLYISKRSINFYRYYIRYT